MNNPLKNILGRKLLINYDHESSLNNPIKSTYISGSNTRIYTSVFEYNDKGYPTKQTTTEQTSTTPEKEITEYTY